MKTIAVAIPTYGREQVLIDTLECLREQTHKPDQIIVVDQTKIHETSTKVWLEKESELGFISYHQLETPNLPKARNFAIDKCASDIIIFIDDDVKLSKEFVAMHLKAYNDENVHAVAGRVKQTNMKRIEFGEATGIRQFMTFNFDSNESYTKLACFQGCHHSLLRDVLIRVGGYDENYLGWAYREETDLAIRVWKSGYNIIYSPKISLEHLAVPTGGCRVAAKADLINWKISYPELYFITKLMWPTYEYWYFLLFSFRKYVFTKKNILNPFFLLMALLGYCISFIKVLAFFVVKNESE
jgi:GT2 family glycosyltransferase